MGENSAYGDCMEEDGRLCIMTYDQALDAVQKGSYITDGKNIGMALRILVLFGNDYIATDAPCRASNFSVKHASLVSGSDYP